MTIRHFHHADNLNDCPLFAWANARDLRNRWQVPLATRIISTRHALSLHRAALVCQLAGIGNVE